MDEKTQPGFLACFLGIPAFSQVQTNALKKASRINRGEYYRDLSNADGGYLFVNFGVRYRDATEYGGRQFEYNSYMHGVNYGYRKNNLSLETGLQFFYHTTGNLRLTPEINFNWALTGEKNSPVIPFSVRYDIPFGEEQNFRFSASFSANGIVMPLNREYLDGKIPVSSGDDQFKLTYDSRRTSPFFFKAGLHGRLILLKSSFWIFQMSRSFSLGSNREYNFYRDDIEFVSHETELKAGCGGWAMSFHCRC